MSIITPSCKTPRRARPRDVKSSSQTPIRTPVRSLAPLQNNSSIANILTSPASQNKPEGKPGKVAKECEKWEVALALRKGSSKLPIKLNDKDAKRHPQPRLQLQLDPQPQPQPRPQAKVELQSQALPSPQDDISSVVLNTHTPVGRVESRAEVRVNDVEEDEKPKSNRKSDPSHAGIHNEKKRKRKRSDSISTFHPSVKPPTTRSDSTLSSSSSSSPLSLSSSSSSSSSSSCSFISSLPELALATSPSRTPAPCQRTSEQPVVPSRSGSGKELESGHKEAVCTSSSRDHPLLPTITKMIILRHLHHWMFPKQVPQHPPIIQNFVLCPHYAIISFVRHLDSLSNSVLSKHVVMTQNRPQPCCI
ncbi:hypothetical protein CI109_103749 [Kwoniella shandongensis]|uniref:Uncharacterized protein n=1 Tax=Kwoniella shandongensis TaxID=1734106 RepID=A0A5M6C7N3_9TREE|nr:uncharacterized protein CI109_000555 [Kwoniella shandongensis]KAA5530983.1 hypothetical protein CI109_000555 [Kwoniella shandongensis]